MALEPKLSAEADKPKSIAARAIFILTTNAASLAIAEMATRFADDRDAMNRATKEALRDHGFAPEVLSRIDRVFSFAPLVGLDVARVVALEIEKLVKDYGLELVGEGIDPIILMDAIERNRSIAGDGVRELTRVIEADISDALIDAKNDDATKISLENKDGVIVAHIEETREEDTDAKS